MTSILLVGAGLALTMAAGGSQAAPAKPVEVVGQRLDPDQLVERVGYGDLDLARAPGQRLLTRRVRSAVGRVCEPLDATGLDARHQACQTQAWRGARPQMARAVERARQLAATGRSAIPDVAIAVVGPTSF